MLILFPFARCHVCWCMQTCNVYMDSTIIFYFLFCRDSSITWQAIFNQVDVVGSQAWADGWTKTNVAPKNIHTLFFLVVGDMNSLVFFHCHWFALYTFLLYLADVMTWMYGIQASSILLYHSNLCFAHRLATSSTFLIAARYCGSTIGYVAYFFILFPY